jgi:hypothetical protein
MRFELTLHPGSVILAKMTAKPLIGRLPMARLGFYLVSILMAVAVWRFTNYMNARPYDPASLNQADPGRAVDAYENINNLLITLGTGILGAMGFLLTNKPNRQYRFQDLWPASLSVVCVGVSLYFGYVSFVNVEFVVGNTIGTIQVELAQWPQKAHFLTLLAGVFFFADFVMQDLGKAD